MLLYKNKHLHQWIKLDASKEKTAMRLSCFVHTLATFCKELSIFLENSRCVLHQWQQYPQADWFGHFLDTADLERPAEEVPLARHNVQCRNCMEAVKLKLTPSNFSTCFHLPILPILPILQHFSRFFHVLEARWLVGSCGASIIHGSRPFPGRHLLRPPFLSSWGAEIGRKFDIPGGSWWIKHGVCLTLEYFFW